MFTPPPLPPSWDAYHPILVHFPVGLLLSAPVLVVLGLVLHRHRHPINLAALVVMILGVAGLFLAFSSGHAAEQWVDEAGAVGPILDAHEDAADTARILFLFFTPVFAVYTFVPWMMKKALRRAVTAVAGAALLAVYALPSLVLMNTAHLGGRLVHEQGVHARTSVGPAAAEPIGESGEHDGEKDED